MNTVVTIILICSVYISDDTTPYYSGTFAGATAVYTAIAADTQAPEVTLVCKEVHQ
jgi:hypothetical protein